MVQAWKYADNGKPDEPNQTNPIQNVNLADLTNLGITYMQISGNYSQKIDEICQERGYQNRDEVKISPTTLPDYDNKMKMFFTEHLHEDEEIRFVIDGSGYFDVRAMDDDWIRCVLLDSMLTVYRIQVTKGDLLILPAGIYHRFVTDSSHFIHAMRLFAQDPKWTPINRPADENSYRKEYVQSYLKSN